MHRDTCRHVHWSRIGLACLALVLTAGSALAQGGTLKIGYVGGITGACATLTNSAVKATKLAMQEINAGGGVLGRQIEVIFRDSQTKPDEAAKQARDLILSDKVEILTGQCTSSEFMAVLPIAKQYMVPDFSALAGTHRATVELFNPYVFQFQPNSLREGKALAEFAAQQKEWKNLVTMGLDYEWGRVTIQVFTDELQKLRPDIKITKALWPRLGETNLTSYITAALAENPDAIMTVTFGGATNSLIKQGESYGLAKRAKLIVFLSTESLIALGTEMPEGVYGWARAPFYALHTDKAKAFVAKYRAANDGEYPTDWGVLAYDFMQILAAAIKRAGGTDDEKLRTALSTATYETLRGPMSMRALDNTLESPVFIGVTKKLPEYPFPVMTDIKVIPGKTALPSEAVVKRLREEEAKPK